MNKNTNKYKSVHYHITLLPIDGREELECYVEIKELSKWVNRYN